MRPLPLHRLLCAVDLSPQSGRVIGTATDIAGWSGAQLTVVHCVPADRSRPDADPGDRDRLVAGIRALLDTGAPLPPHAGVVVREGPPAVEILGLARTLRPDLIILGRQGRGRRGLGVGSIAESVMAGAEAPLLLVPSGDDGPRAAIGPFRQIVCAVDFSPSARGALDHALSLSLEYQAELLLVHVLPASGRPPLGAAEAHDRLRAAVPESARTWVDSYAVVAAGDPASRILAVADHVGADLIVLGVPRRRLGATASEVVRAARCAVLLAPPLWARAGWDVKRSPGAAPSLVR
jgi:nucleotide-binding universal stress UspA family protein